MGNSRARLVWVVPVLAVVLLAGWWFWSRSSRSGASYDLADNFRLAEKRSNVSPLELAFGQGSYRLRGETRRGFSMHPTSRLIYQQVPIPEHAVLRAWAGLKEEAWDTSVDGVLFRVGVTHDGHYTPLKDLHVNPAHVVDDRRWVPVEVDLSAYAGQTIDLILNTNASPPGGGNDNRYDFAVWGDPTILTRD